jgi:hypothetical protein
LALRNALRVFSNRFRVEEYRTLLIASGGAIAAIVVVAMLVAIIRRRRRARAARAPLPLIPFSPGRRGAVPVRPEAVVTPTHSPTPGVHSGVSTGVASAPTQDWTAPRGDITPQQPQRSSYAPPVDVNANSQAAGAAGSPLADTARPNDLVEGDAVDGASVRYWRPADGTLQFLPGRLEVIAGRDAGQEIRFVRTPGPDGTRVTFGRAEGAPYRHVQLREPTVSRAHARMTLESGGGANAGVPHGHANGARWRLENLSATNPVVVNGRPLAADGSDAGSVCLGEGDRIEMGEVVFRFHEK